MMAVKPLNPSSYWVKILLMTSLIVFYSLNFMRNAMIYPLFFLTLPLLIIIGSCQTVYTQKQVTVIQQFDKSLSLSRDNKTNQLYLQSKNGESKGQCSNFWYSDSASFSVSDNEQKYVNLNQLVDIASLKLDKTLNNEYHLSDKNHRYTVILTLCDNQVSYTNL